ncbi:MAG: UDP-N-acetylmuramoyl-L-alanyl-D-glutamate--2,6-diaminopimelate ligase [Chthonomonadales bacterium]
MKLAELVQRAGVGAIAGPPGVSVQGICHDTRDVKPGDLFVCLVGANFDGHHFAAEAVNRGAAALCVERMVDAPPNVPVVLVEDTRRALPLLASTFYGHPSEGLKLVGVTGTNGKTTTTRLIAAILRTVGMHVGTIGTLGAELDGDAIPSNHTTPEADELQSLLALMRQRGADAVCMEVSSHALAQYRTDGCRFDAAVFTNLTQDHLDYHRDLDAYFNAKMRLFEEYPRASGKPFVAAVNADDPRGPDVLRRVIGKAVTFGVTADAAVRAEAVEVAPDRSSFRAVTPHGTFDVRLNIGGAFQIYNALAATACCLELGVPADAVAAGLAGVDRVPGRFEPIHTGLGWHVIVDYAHTPDGLHNLLASARQLQPARLILVFGCGGNRDRTKRPIMGRIAVEEADRVFITSDNPRDEDPEAILAEILAGIEDTRVPVAVEPDRGAAIAAALAEAREGDVVLVAGKGHEDYQEVKGKRLPFDDRAVIREWLAKCAVR